MYSHSTALNQYVKLPDHTQLMWHS